MSTLPQLLFPAFASPDSSPAIIIPGPTGYPVSHRALHTQTLRLIHTLSTHPSLSPSSKPTTISISLPNSFAFIAAFLAVTCSRAVAAPLNPAYKEDEAAFYMRDVGAKAVVVPRGDVERGAACVVAAGREGVSVIECWAGEDGEVVLEWAGKGEEGEEKKKEEKGEGDEIGRSEEFVVEEDDMALVLHTSGTTGKPKAVPLTHKNLCVSAANITHTYALAPADRTMLIMPLFHVHGLLASFLAPLHARSAAIIPPRLAPSFWRDFGAHGATWYTATPTMHKIILSFPASSHPSAEALSRLRFIRSCSSPLSPATMSELEARFGAPVLEAYAMTEASHQITTNPLPPAPRCPGSVGVPGPSIEVVVLPENSESPLPANHEGEICIRSPSVTTGYISNPAANAASFTPSRYFRTGDFGRLDSEGYLTLTGRMKEFINKGGEKVSPVEVDNVIAAHPAVKDVVCFAIEDEMYGQDVGAAVILKEGGQGEGEEKGEEKVGARELQKWVRARVAPLKVPKKIWFPAEIPKTATGKVQRKLVAEQMLKLQSG